jgi:hypothetical protein
MSFLLSAVAFLPCRQCCPGHIPGMQLAANREQML